MDSGYSAISRKGMIVGAIYGLLWAVIAITGLSFQPGFGLSSLISLLLIPAGIKIGLDNDPADAAAIGLVLTPVLIIVFLALNIGVFVTSA
jgi:hypothetical protein